MPAKLHSTSNPMLLGQKITVRSSIGKVWTYRLIAKTTKVNKDNSRMAEVYYWEGEHDRLEYYAPWPFGGHPRCCPSEANRLKAETIMREYDRLVAREKELVALLREKGTGE